jgi:hypothetical protein
MGLTKPRASQIFDLDYKQATRVITISDITLAGSAPSQVDGVNLAEDDRVLVSGQSDPTQNGLYIVSSVGTGSDGTWVRTSDGNETGEIAAGMIVMVTEGVIYHDTQWKLTTNDPIVIGTTALTFVINILSQIGGANTQIQYNNSGTMGASANLTWNGTTLYANGIVSATGNIIGGNISVANISGTLITASQTNITSVGTLGSLSVTGDITSAGNVAALNFNSTSADLAENYEADADYAPGTVVVFGGNKEITVSNKNHDTAVAGIISTAPSYLMNSAQPGQWVLPVALTGRVPCFVQGPVSKGTVLVTGDTPGTAMAVKTSKFAPGCVVGKSLENIKTNEVKTIEVAVGRL